MKSSGSRWKQRAGFLLHALLVCSYLQHSCHAEKETVKGTAVKKGTPVQSPPPPSKKTPVVKAAATKKAAATPASIYVPITCEAHSKKGNCKAQWMRKNGWCARTCGFCKDPPPPPPPPCDNVQPPGGITCAQLQLRGDCGAAWMYSGFYCARTCGFCGRRPPPPAGKATPAAPPAPLPIEKPAVCNDISSSDQFTCAQQKAWRKCNEKWMRDYNFCAITCGFCTPGDTNTTKAATNSSGTKGKVSNTETEAESSKGSTGRKLLSVGSSLSRNRKLAYRGDAVIWGGEERPLRDGDASSGGVQINQVGLEGGPGGDVEEAGGSARYLAAAAKVPVPPVVRRAPPPSPPAPANPCFDVLPPATYNTAPLVLPKPPSPSPPGPTSRSLRPPTLELVSQPPSMNSSSMGTQPNSSLGTAATSIAKDKPKSSGGSNGFSTTVKIVLGVVCSIAGLIFIMLLRTFLWGGKAVWTKARDVISPVTANSWRSMGRPNGVMSPAPASATSWRSMNNGEVSPGPQSAFTWRSMSGAGN